MPISSPGPRSLTLALAVVALAAACNGPPTTKATVDENRATRRAAPGGILVPASPEAATTAIVPAGSRPTAGPNVAPVVTPTVPPGPGSGLGTPTPAGTPGGLAPATPGSLATPLVGLPLDRLASAPLISDKGLGLFPGGGILSNNGAGIVSNNGGNLVGEVRFPTGPAGFRLTALADRAVPGVQVRLLSERGVAYGPVATTDASGSFRFDLLPSTLPYLVVEATEGARTVRAIAQAPSDGQTRVTLDAASTGATALALGRVLEDGAPVAALSPQAYVDAVLALREALDAPRAATMVGAAPLAAAALARDLLGVVPPLAAATPVLGPFVGGAGAMNGNRQYFQALAAGPWLYVIGAGPLERAPIAADGTVGAFSGAGLVSPPAGLSQHSLAANATSAYMIGGVRAGTYQTTVSRTAIAASGDVSAFVDAPSGLNTPRGLAASVVVGQHLYVLGGGDLVGIVGTIERATLQPDGTPGPFTLVGSLAVPRVSHSAHVIGGFVYVVGGWSMSPGPVAEGRVERAAIQFDGSLGPFAVVPGVTLAAARYDHVGVVVGDGLYVFGGASGDPLSGAAPALGTVERAAIAADGALAPFATQAQTLVSARKAHAAALVGGACVVLGGGTRNLERAALTLP